MAFIARGVTKTAVVRSIGLDEYFILDQLFVTIQSVIVTLQTLHGYRKPLASAKPAEVEKVLKVSTLASWTNSSNKDDEARIWRRSGLH